MSFMTYLLFIHPLLIITPQNPQNVEKQIINHILNKEYVNADSLITLQLSKEPKSLKYHFFLLGLNKEKLNAAYYTDLLSNKEYKAKAANLITQIEKYLSTLNLNGKQQPLEEKFFLAGIYGYIGMLSGEINYFKAFKYGKKANALLNEVVLENPRYYDAYYGIGLFKYYVSRLGWIIRFVAKILGLQGDREKGLEYLEIVCKKGDLSQDQAMFNLATIYLNMEENEEKALPLLKQLLAKFPRNDFIVSNYFTCLRNIHNYARMIPFFQKHQHQLSSFKKGIYYLEIGEFVKANVELNLSLQKYPTNYYVRYKKAIAQWLNDDSTDIPTAELPDHYKQMAAELQADSMSKSILKTCYTINRYNRESDVSSLLIFRNKIQSQLVKDKVSLTLGVYYFNQGLFDQAKVNFKFCLGFKYHKLPALKYLLTIFERNLGNDDEFQLLAKHIEKIDNKGLFFRLQSVKERFLTQKEK